MIHFSIINALACSTRRGLLLAAGRTASYLLCLGAFPSAAWSAPAAPAVSATTVTTAKATPAPTPAPNPQIDAVRLECFKRGLYKITGNDLARTGVALDSIDVAHLALEHFGQSAPFDATGLEDGRFDPNDTLFFYSGGATELPTPYINTEKNYYPPTQNFILHLRSWQAPVRYAADWPKAPAAVESAYTTGSVSARVHVEENQLTQFFELNGATGYQTDYIFWSKLTYPESNKTTTTQVCKVNLTSLDPRRAVKLRTLLYATSATPRPGIEHSIAVEVNGQAAGKITWLGHDRHQAELDVPAGLFKEGDNQVRYTIQEPVDQAAVAGQKPFLVDMIMFDWLEVDYPRLTRVANNAGEFIFEPVARPLRLRFDGFTKNDVRVYDLAGLKVLEPGSFALAPGAAERSINVECPNTTATLAIASEAQMFVPYSIKPLTLTRHFDEPSDCDLLILTHPDFTQALAPLVDWKRSRGLKVQLAQITDLCNERSGGYITTSVIRDYIGHVAQSGPKGHLKYVLLVGDSCTLAKYQTFVPAYAYLQSGTHANDNYYATAQNPEDAPQYAVGRFSVRTTEQLQNIMRKEMDFESGKLAGSWQAHFLVIAAAFNWAKGDAEHLLDGYVHPAYRSTFIQSDVQNPDPQLHQRLTTQLNEKLNAGSLITVFFGHGGGTVWEVGPSIQRQNFQLHLFDQRNVEKLTNTAKPTLVFALTCYTNDFDNPDVGQTLGEAFVNSPGGALGVLGTSGRSSTVQNAQLAEKILELLEHQPEGGRIGDFIAEAKRQLKSEYVNTNYNYLGDPSLEFALPRPDIKLTQAPGDAPAVRYTLPAQVKVPAQLDCQLLNEQAEPIAQWSAPAPQAKGTIACQLPADRATSGTLGLSLSVYVPGERGGHVGLLVFDKKSPAAAKPAAPKK